MRVIIVISNVEETETHVVPLVYQTMRKAISATTPLSNVCVLVAARDVEGEEMYALILKNLFERTLS